MKLIECLLIFGLLAAVCDGENCDYKRIIYKEMGCTIKYVSEGNCPRGHVCSNYTTEAGHCKYQGILYKLNEKISNNLDCDRDCYCRMDSTSKTQIICNKPKCFNEGPISRDCYMAYKSLNECCPSSKICAPFDNGMAVCEEGGVFYREGQIFTPKGTCKRCMCKKGYQSGLYEEPYCYTKPCNVEFKYSQELANKCAPVYTKEDQCCPATFVCLEEAEPIIEKQYSSGKIDLYPCWIGNKRIRTKSKFDVQLNRDGFGKVTCWCSHAPYVACYNE